MGSSGTILQDRDWQTLIYKIQNGLCTPFIGAGASYPVLPLGGQLATALIEEEEKWGKKCPLKDRTDLPKVAQYLAVTHDDGTWPKLKIRDFIKNRPQTDFTDENEPHRVLADLELPIYLTTNYDNFMVTALRRKHPQARQEFARWTRKLLEENSSDFDDGYEPSPENPVVFHLHGHTEFYEGMVASEDDYLDFLVNISKDLGSSPSDARKRAMLPPRIRRAITSSTLLFIGYSLGDINFRVILRGLVGSLERAAKQVNIAVQFAGDDPSELKDYLEQYFQYTLQLKVFWGSAAEFAQQLRSRWRH
jgi:hypothetical protein